MFALKVSYNNTRTCWVLKCDIRKFFASIDHVVLFGLLQNRIPDPDILWLLGEVVGSFSSRSALDGGRVGLPLGNLTSQLLVNVYMNEFDQYVKHVLKASHYIRYADDFVFISYNKKELELLRPSIETFLEEKLKLVLHPDKVFIKTFASGVDFLGWVHFPDHRVLRTSTKRRLIRRISGLEKAHPTTHSYLSMLSHGNTNKLREKIEKNSFTPRQPRDARESRRF